MTRRGVLVGPWAALGGAVGCGLWGVLALLAGCGDVRGEAPPDATPGVSAGQRMFPSSAPVNNHRS